MDRDIVLPPGLVLVDPKVPFRRAYAPSNFDPWNNRSALSREGIFLGINDQLELRVWNSNVSVTKITMRCGILLENGELQFTNRYLTVTSNRLESNGKFTIGIGWLVSVMIYEDPIQSKRGQTFAVVDVFDKLTSFHSIHLISNYIYEPHHPVWPGTPLIGSIEGPGFLRAITGTNPAAGVNIIETVPTNARWKLRACTCTLVVANSGAARAVTVLLVDSAIQYFNGTSFITQAINTTATWNISDGIPNTTITIAAQMIQIPTDVLIKQAGSFQVTVTIFAAADDLSAPSYYVEEWIDAD